MINFDKAANIFSENNGTCISGTTKKQYLNCSDCPFESKGDYLTCPNDEICYQWAIGYLAIKKKNIKDSKKVLKKPCSNCNGMGMVQVGTNSHYFNICKICDGAGIEE